jgi:hypothetical protein
MVAHRRGAWLCTGICCVAMFSLGGCGTKKSADGGADVAGDRPASEDRYDAPADAPTTDAPMDAAADLRDAAADLSEAGRDASDAASPDGAPGDGGAGRCPIVHIPPVTITVDAILADMDGDGHLDIVALLHDGRVGIYRGDGRRSFAAPAVYDTTPDIMNNRYLQTIAAGDVDSDGKLDLAVVTASGRIAVLLAQAGGGFAASQLGPVGSQESSDHIAIADFDGDGHPDIAQTVGPGVTNQHTVGFWWGTGGGAFLPRVHVPACTSPVHLRVIDANEDGRPDLVVGCYSASSRVLINGGGRGFTAAGAGAIPFGSVRFDTADGDLNGDGHVDLVFPDYASKQVRVFLGDGAGQFSAPTGLLAKPPAEPFAAALGDFDGDGRADLVIGDFTPQQLYFYSGTGDGHLQASTSIAVPGSGNAVAVADIDGDGIDDIVSDDWDKGIDVLFGPCP